MDIDTIETKLQAAEERLTDARHTPLMDVDTPHQPLRLHLTDRLRNRCRREKKWRARALRVALSNARFGYDPSAHQRGTDGIFKVNPDHVTANRMIDKLFARFLDKPDPLVAVLEASFGPRKAWVPVRLVAEPFRLLGVLIPGQPRTHLVLVDLDLGRQNEGPS